MFMKDIKMEFEIITCEHFRMRWEKLVKMRGMKSQLEDLLEQVQSQKGYFRRGWYNAWESKKSTAKGVLLKIAINFVIKIQFKKHYKTVNSTAISLVRYWNGIFKWREE